MHHHDSFSFLQIQHICFKLQGTVFTILSLTNLKTRPFVASRYRSISFHWELKYFYGNYNFQVRLVQIRKVPAV